MNRKEAVLMILVMLGTFVTGVYASNPASQLANVFVTNFPKNQNVTVTNPSTSHLEQPIKNHVTLFCYVNATLTRLDIYGLMGNGTIVPHFSIPARSALVVTDVEWFGNQGSPGNTVVLFLVGSPVLPAVHESWTTVNPDGTFRAVDHLTAGFVVSPPNQIAGEQIGPIGSGAYATLIMYGYLMGVQ